MTLFDWLAVAWTLCWMVGFVSALSTGVAIYLIYPVPVALGHRRKAVLVLLGTWPWWVRKMFSQLVAARRESRSNG